MIFYIRTALHKDLHEDILHKDCSQDDSLLLDKGGENNWRPNICLLGEALTWSSVFSV